MVMTMKQGAVLLLALLLSMALPTLGPTASTNQQAGRAYAADEPNGAINQTGTDEPNGANNDCDEVDPITGQPCPDL
jgi:hypothetical protein